MNNPDGDNLNENAKAEVLKLFKGLPDKMDGFQSIDIYDISESSEEYQTVFVLQFETVDAFKE